MIAVYVPTNHLYLGDVIICPRDKAVVPRHHRGAGHPDLPDRRDGASPAGSRRGAGTIGSAISASDPRSCLSPPIRLCQAASGNVCVRFAELLRAAPGRRSGARDCEENDVRYVLFRVCARYRGGHLLAAAPPVCGRALRRAGAQPQPPLTVQQEAAPGTPAARRTWCCRISASVDFQGINGRTLLMGGLGVCVLGLAFGLTIFYAAEEPAGAPLDARDLRADLRDLQDLSDHAGQVHPDPRGVHRRDHGVLLRRAAALRAAEGRRSSCCSA